MRKLEHKAVEAFYDGRSGRFGRNTFVELADGWVLLKLHSIPIARRFGGRVEIRHGGWATYTTRSRLNAVIQRLGARVQQVRRRWILTLKNGSSAFIAEQHIVKNPGLRSADPWCVVDYGSDLERLAFETSALNKG